MAQGREKSETQVVDHSFPPKSLKRVDSCESFICERNQETGEWMCKPYRAQSLQDEIDNSNEEGIIAKLKELGIKVYIVPHGTLREMFSDIRRVVRRVSRDSIDIGPEVKSCMLYQDKHKRLYNIQIKNNAVDVASRWKETLENFSGFEAMVAMTVLSRSFPCASKDETQNLKPAYLSLILGLVFSEEISFSWVNTRMFIRGTPSLSAFGLTSKLGADWLKKIVLLSLTLAGAATGSVQKGITIFGIAMTFFVMSANLGARAWNFLRLKPIRVSDGLVGDVIGFIVAVATGLTIPYMGHGSIRAGGKPAMESMLLKAFFIALIFVISDFHEIQEFLILQSGNCNQDVVNIVVGGWFTLTLVTCIFLVNRIPTDRSQCPKEDEEPILEEDQASPVGYKVPNLPTFPLDPNIPKRGICCCPLTLEIFFGIIMAFGIGGFIIYTSFVRWDDEFANSNFEDVF